MGESRISNDPVGKALALMEEALAVVDGVGDLDLIGAKLQQAIDAARDHQSRASPRA